MALPLYVLHHHPSHKNYKERVLLNQLSDFEVRKHTGLPRLGVREIMEWLIPELDPILPTMP